MVGAADESDLGRAIVAEAPSPLTHVFFVNAGTEANDEVNVDNYLVGGLRIMVSPNRRDPVRSRLQVIYVPEAGDAK